MQSGRNGGSAVVLGPKEEESLHLRNESPVRRARSLLVAPAIRTKFVSAQARRSPAPRNETQERSAAVSEYLRIRDREWTQPSGHHRIWKWADHPASQPCDLG